jgi:hypothetical protein
MDQKTLKALIAEAQKRAKKATAAWRKHDNYEDMKEMETWIEMTGWLQSKLPQG